MRHSIGMPVQLALLLSIACLVGCGGEASNNVESDGSQSVSGVDSSLPDGSATKEPVSAGAGSGSKSSTGPASETGIQMPEGDLPETSQGETGTENSRPESGGPTKPGAGGLEMPDQSSATPSQPSSSVDLQFASWKAIETAAKSTGKITVVDLWSTVCAPCVKEFPGLVRLSKAMPDDVTCIGVSVDYDGRKSRPPESYSEKVGAFLTAVGADFDNYLCNTPSEDVFSDIGLPSIPAVLIYDAKGTLLKKFVDAGDTIGFTYEADVTPFVEKLPR